MRSSDTVRLVALVCGLAACAPAAGRITERAGTPSPTGCDAWFEIGGTFSRVEDGRYTLRNRSANAACLTTRVTVTFAAPLRPGALRVSAPAGWATGDVPCGDRAGFCGVEWHSPAGVSAGDDLSGFGLAYDAAVSPRPKAWSVEVGPRRVVMPIGTVGGRLGEAR